MMRLRCAAALILAVVVQALGGCNASPRVDSSELASLPDDFTLDVSVMAGRNVGAQYGAHLQPMRYVILPDGTLRSGSPAITGAWAGSGGGMTIDDRSIALGSPFSQSDFHNATVDSDGTDTLPGVTRVLSRRQMESLWDLVRDAGLADASRREPPLNLATVNAPADRTIYIAQFHAADRNWSVRGPAPIAPMRSDDSNDEPAATETDSIAAIDPTLIALVKRLAELAWVSDEPPGSIRLAPIRYDFGPDPYARYREP